MDEDNVGKKEIGDILFGLKRRWDNIWYHYKIAIISGAAILIFIIIAISQCSSKIEGDANIAYIGLKELDAEEYEYLHKNFHEILGEDLNGDGEIYVDFAHFLYMTENQARDRRADGSVVDVQSLLVTQTQINLALADGSSIIYFMDPEAYKILKKSGNVNTFMPLEDALGYVPEKQSDEFSIRLKDLYCWEYYYGIGSFPPNTVVAVRDRQNSDKNNKKMDDKYERNLLMFKRLVEYDKNTAFGDFGGDDE